MDIKIKKLEEKIKLRVKRARQHYEELSKLNVPTKGAMEREKNVAWLVSVHLAERIKLKQIIRDPNTTTQERLSAKFKLSQLPRSSSPTRLRNRCSVTGRARAYNRLTKLGRHALLKMVGEQLIPGIQKVSW